jgi:phospholipid/cholesterol/gamma-HCH transport system permease protein
MLVVPRMLALMIGLPLLTSMANIVGTLSGMGISAIEPTLQIEPRDYLDEVQRVVRVEDFLSGMIKPVFFGFLIALVACYQGFKTQGGTEGVGQATTRTVVIAAILILINDYFLTKLVILLFPIAQ